MVGLEWYPCCRLKPSCGTWSKIAIKQRLLSTKNSNVMYFYGMKLESSSKDSHSSGFDMIFRKQLRCGCNITLLTCIS